MTISADLEPPDDLAPVDLPDPALPAMPDWPLDLPSLWAEPPPSCGGDCACGGAAAPDRPDPVLREILGQEAFADLVAEAEAAAAGSTWEAASALDAPDAPEDAATSAAESVRWAVPGVWDDEPDPKVLTPSVGPLVTQLVDVLDQLAQVDPTGLDPGQALGEAEALLGAQRALRVLQLARTEDVASRLLHEQRGFRSAKAWLSSVAPDAPQADRTLAHRLTALPHLAAAVHAGRVSLAGATKTAAALGKVRKYLDRPDGLVDGGDGEELLVAVGDNVLDLLCKHHFGLDPADPAQAALLVALQTEVDAVHAEGGSQAARLERLLVILTVHLPVRALRDALEDVVFQVLPNSLERRELDAQDKRAVSLSPNEDGTWDLSGTLTPECGELLFTALAAEARRDPANPVDTLIREQRRREEMEAQGQDPFLHDVTSLPAWEQQALHALNLQPGARAVPADELQDLLAAPAPCRADEQPLIPTAARDAASDPAAAAEAALVAGDAGFAAVHVARLAGGPAGHADDVVGQLLVPRSRSKRLHDAFQRLLERYLSSGLGGSHGKVPVQAMVTVSSRTVDNLPGAPPGRGSSGRPLARSLIRRWWCDAHVTTLLMSHGWTPPRGRPLSKDHHRHRVQGRDRAVRQPLRRRRLLPRTTRPAHPPRAAPRHRSRR